MNFKWLITGALFSSIGMSFVWPLTSVYLHNRLGVSLTWIGVVLLFNSLASVLGSYLGGYLYDRKNPYHLLVGGVVASTITLLVLIFFFMAGRSLGSYCSLMVSPVAGIWRLSIQLEPALKQRTAVTSLTCCILSKTWEL